MLFRQLAYAGDRDGALAILDKRRRALLPRSGQPNALGSSWMLALVIEGLVMLGEQSQAAQLYLVVEEKILSNTLCRHIHASQPRRRSDPPPSLFLIFVMLNPTRLMVIRQSRD
jgi:hypothetical protein